MELKEFKEKTQSKVVDIIANLGVFTLSEIMDIEDIREAKKSFDELSDLINEYIEENDKPKFKVGDYVTVYVNSRRKTAKIEKIDELVENNSKVHGLWYDRALVNFKQDYWYSSGLNEFRHATPEEIVEYESALQFHKHGRNPFEVKEGDLIRTPNEEFTFICNPENYTNEVFLDYGWEFLKTVEEVNEWLGVSDE